MMVPRDPRLGCILLALIEFAVFGLTGTSVYLASSRLVPDESLLNFLVTGALSFITGHALAQSYDCDRMTRIARTSRAAFILIPALVTAMAIAFAILLQTLISERDIAIDSGLAPQLAMLVAATATIALERAVFYLTLSRLREAGHLMTNVVVFGADDIGQRLISVIRDDYHQSVVIRGLYDDRLERTAAVVMGLPVAGGMDELVSLVNDSKSIDKVLIALPMSAQGRILALLERLRPLPVDIALVPELIDIRLDRQIIRDPHPPFLNLSRKPQSELGVVLKRAFDILAASAALILLSPFLLVTAACIKLDSSGPVLFRQPRMGFNNKEFHVLKFRTMYANRADLAARQQTQRNDTRITRLGAWLRRSSIDELPQLINVLRGDMSLVGPRPHALGMQVADRPCDHIVREYAVRHRMKPGITGWAQVCGLRGAVDEPSILEARVHHDIYYIDNWSFFFDLWILIMTVGVLVRPRNAF
jgi:Undecaprenyl-phosphate glucose phosphotransferase